MALLLQTHMFTRGSSADASRHAGRVEQQLTKQVRPLLQPDGKTHEEGSGDGWVRAQQASAHKRVPNRQLHCSCVRRRAGLRAVLR